MITPKEVKELISSIIKADQFNLNICLEGQQGIGKTSVLKQLAEELGFHYSAIYGAQVAPEDLIGLPKNIEKDGKYITIFSEPVLLPKHEKTIFVLEEINRAPIEVQQAVLQLLTDKQVSGHKLPDKTLVCVSINPTEGGVYMTQELDSVFRNRMLNLKVVPNKDEFVEFIKDRWDSRIINFIDSMTIEESRVWFAKKPEPNDIGKALPSPRTWEMVNQILKVEGMPIDLVKETISSAIGDDAMKAFVSRQDINAKLSVSPEDMLKSYTKVKAKVEALNDSEMTSFINQLKHKINDKKSLTDKEFNNFGQFVKYLFNRPTMFALVNETDTSDTTFIEYRVVYSKLYEEYEGGIIKEKEGEVLLQASI